MEKGSDETLMLKRATAELERATPEELSAATNAYAAYHANPALPSLESCPVLERYGWLRVARAVERRAQLAAERLLDVEEERREVLVQKLLSDRRVAKLLGPERLGAFRRMLNMEVPELLAAMLESVVGAAATLEQERATLQVYLGAVFNSQEPTQLQQELLRASAVQLRRANLREAADFLEACAAGRVEVEPPEGARVEGGPHQVKG
jgi:hypothetical protein